MKLAQACQFKKRRDEWHSSPNGIRLRMAKSLLKRVPNPETLKPPQTKKQRNLSEFKNYLKGLTSHISHLTSQISNLTSQISRLKSQNQIRESEILSYLCAILHKTNGSCEPVKQKFHAPNRISQYSVRLHSLQTHNDI